MPLKTCISTIFAIQYFIVISAIESNPALIVDLSWPFNNATVTWPTSRPFEFTRQLAGFNANGVWYSANEFCAGEHSGTHIDAPYHFNESAWRIGQIPVERFVTNGVLIDVSHIVRKTGPDTLLLRSHLEDWIDKHGDFAPNTVVLVKFGWSALWANATAYLGITPITTDAMNATDVNNNNDGQEKTYELHFPGFSAETAEWIARNGNIVGVGVDTASVDCGISQDYMTHRILANNQMYILENVRILGNHSLPDRGFTLISLPMNIEEGTGAAVRIVALVDKSST